MTSNTAAGKTITVFGGSGFVGRHLVQRLAAQGWRVRVAVRRPHEATGLGTMGDVGQVQVMQANVRDVASVEQAVQGAEVVVNLTGILVQGGKQKFRTVHAAGAGNVARAAAAAGASRLVHMSVLGVDKTSDSSFLRSNAAGEEEVREAFPSATIVRPSVIFGLEDGFISRNASVIRMLPVVPLIGFGKTRFQPIHVNDVVDAFMSMISSTETEARVVELGGPQVLTLGEIQRMIARDMGRLRFFLPWPFWATKINAFFLQMPYTFLRIPAILTVDQVRLLQRDSVVGISGEEGVLTTLDLTKSPLINLGTVLPDYLVRFRKHGQYDERPATS